MVAPEEFVPQEGKVPVVVIKPYGTSFQEAIDRLQEDPLVQLIECSTTVEAASIIHGMPCALILFHCARVPEVVPQITLLKLLKEEIQAGTVRALLTTFIDEVAVLSKLAFYGCAEVVPEPITGKSLLFKLQRHIKALSGQTTQKKKEASLPSKERKLTTPARNSASLSEAPMFRYSNPLEVAKEEWYLAQSAPKKIGRRWLVQMLGPSPQEGDWVPGKKDQEWLWKPRDFEALSRMKEGNYVLFTGDRPDFKEGFWLFLAVAPEFSIYEAGQPKGLKISVDNFNILVLAKNLSEVLPLPVQKDFQEVKRINFIKKVNRPALKRNTGSTNGKKDSRSLAGVQKLAEDLKKGIQEHAQETSIFGYPPGKWELVGDQPKDQKGYIYIPFELSTRAGGESSANQWKEYWFYIGPRDPLLKKSASGTAWVFYGNPPVRFEKFDDLQPSVQNFLQKKFPAQGSTKSSSALDSASPGTSSSAPNLSSKADESPLPQWDSVQLNQNPMVLSLLLSEIMVRRTESPKDWAQQFCYQVSQLMNGVRTELWVYQKSTWKCTNTWDGSPGEFQSSLNRVESFPWTSDTGVLVSPVLFRAGEEDEVIGALLFGGGGSDQVPVDSAQALSVMAKGLLRGVLGK